MGKRSNFARIDRDNYATPAMAIEPLLAHLKPGTKFIDPAAGAGRLIEHLEKAGHVCVYASDLPYRDATSASYDDVERSALFLTNLPWDRSVLHPAIVNLSNQRLLWTLCDAGWLFTRQAGPFMPRLRCIVSVRRLKWIEGTKHGAMDDAVWLQFGRPQLNGQAATRFFGRIECEQDGAAP